MGYMADATISMADEEGDAFWRSRSGKMDLPEIMTNYWALPAIPVDSQYRTCTQYQRLNAQLLREEGLQKFRHALKQVVNGRAVPADVPRYGLVRVLARHTLPETIAVLLRFEGPPIPRKRL